MVVVRCLDRRRLSISTMTLALISRGSSDRYWSQGGPPLSSPLLSHHCSEDVVEEVVGVVVEGVEVVEVVVAVERARR